MSSTLSSNCPLRRYASYISRRPLAICDAKVQNSTPITTSASLSTSFCHGRRLFLLAALSLPPHLAHVSTPLPHHPPSSRERHPHAPNTHITPDHNVTPTARPVRRRRGGGVLPAMRRRVRPLRQELPPLSLRLPSMLHCQHIAESPRTVVLTHVLDMSVLLQQHQDDNERAMPCLSSAVRRFHHRVEDHLPRRVGPRHLPRSY
jgi:hypothetical protein